MSISVDAQLESTQQSIQSHREIVRKYHHQANPPPSPPPEPPKPEATSDKLERWERESWDSLAGWMAWYKSESQQWAERGREAAQAEQRAREERAREQRAQEIGREWERDLQWQDWLKRHREDMARFEAEYRQREENRRMYNVLLNADAGREAIEVEFAAGRMDREEYDASIAELEGRSKAQA